MVEYGHRMVKMCSPASTNYEEDNLFSSKVLKCRLSAMIHVRKCLNGLLTYFGMRKITCFLVNDLH